MTKVVTRDFLNGNQYRRYPLYDEATYEPYSGADSDRLDAVIVDISMTVPSDLVGCVYLASLVVTDSLVTAVFVASRTDSAVVQGFTGGDRADSVYDALGGLVVATVSTTRSRARDFRPVSMSPEVDGVVGWVCFGNLDGISGSWQFSGPAATRLSDRAVTRVSPAPCRTIGISGLSGVLDGDVTLDGANGIEVVKEGTSSLKIEFSGDARTVQENLQRYAGSCGGRPESGSCSHTPIRTVNGVYPDADGLITLEFDRSIPLVLTAEGVLMASSSITIESMCHRQGAPGSEPCDDVTLSTPAMGVAFLQSGLSEPMSEGTVLRLTVDDGVNTTYRDYTYVHMHPKRPNTAVLTTTGAAAILDEQPDELHVDLRAGTWQAYDRGAASLNLYGPVSAHYQSSVRIGSATVALGPRLSVEQADVTELRVGVLQGDASLDPAGDYARTGVGTYSYGDYVLTVRPSGSGEVWALYSGRRLLAAGTFTYDIGTDNYGLSQLAGAAGDPDVIYTVGPAS